MHGAWRVGSWKPLVLDMSYRKQQLPGQQESTGPTHWAKEDQGPLQRSGALQSLLVPSWGSGGQLLPNEEIAAESQRRLKCQGTALVAPLTST